MHASLSGATIAKRLASCNKSTRDRAVRALTAWLPQQPDAAVSDGDLLKIWKGLFYCVWHSDKLPVQVDLINRLATLLEALAPPLAGRYLDAFVLTIRREWAGIDFLRLDKFYLLNRRFLRHLFLLLRKNSWDLDLSARLIGILFEKSLLATDKYPAQGVSYHIAEIFLDEINEFLPLCVETLDVILKPFLSVLEKSLDKVLLTKIKVNVFDRFLEYGVKLLEVEKAGNKVESGSDVEKFGKIALVLSFSNKFFESASASETLQGNRKVLFGLYHRFLKLEKHLEKSGVHFSLQHLENGNSVRVTELMILENSEQLEVEIGSGDGAKDDQPPKKKKKKSNKASLEVPEPMIPDKSEQLEVEIGSGEGASDDQPPKKKKKKKKSKKASLKAPEPMISDNSEQFEVEIGNGDGASDDQPPKKKKKLKKASDGTKKKSKSKKKPLDSNTETNGAKPITEVNNIVDGGNVNGDATETHDLISFDESAISNLQMQFEKAAAEAGMANDNEKSSALSATLVTNTVPKKRKRARKSDGKTNFSGSDANGGMIAGKSEEKSIKKVRFSMKNNLVWKPHNPLPPQSLRLPPSATPRGSALKKGIPAGPIKETPPTVKKIKVKADSVKKGRKRSTVSSAVKHLRKLQSLSA